MTQNTVLAERGSRYLALAAVDQFSYAPLSLSPLQRQKLLTAPHFFRKLDQLLQDNSGPLIRRLVLRKLFLPFCEKYAPVLLKKSVDKIVQTALVFLGPHTPFPAQFVSDRLENLITYFTVLHSALERVACEPIMTGKLHEHIERELEHAQSATYSTEQLYAKILHQGIVFCLNSIEEFLSDCLKEKAFYIQLPAQKIMEIGCTGLRIMLPSLLWLNRSRILPPLQEQAKSDISSRMVDSLHHPLVSSLIRFANAILEAFFETLRIYQNPAKASLPGIDKDLFKQCVQQQILLLKLTTSSSQSNLRTALKRDSGFDQLLSKIQDRYIESLVKSTNGLISIFWETITRPGFLKEELHRLLASFNRGLIDTSCDDEALPKLEKTIENISKYLISKQVHNSLRQTEHCIDKKLTIFSSWPDKKKIIVKAAKEWLGQPIKSAIAKQAISFSLQASNEITEKLVKFWLISYNLRYGIFHYGILFPLLKTPLAPSLQG